MAAAQQYLGNKLCLVSKALLRYEGILHSIDPVKASLTLANVKCFGTENRSKDFIPPSDVIYGHISFKGENLKDIFMCDEKKSDFPDPAIIEHSDPVRPNSASSSISYSNLISNVGRVAATTTQPTFVPTPIGMPPSTYNFMGQNHEDVIENNINQQQSLPSSRSVSPLQNHHHHKKSPTNDQSTQMTPMTKDYGQGEAGGPSTKYRPGGDYHHQMGHNNNNMGGGGGRRDNFSHTRVGPPPPLHNYHNNNNGPNQHQHNFQGGNHPNYNSNRFGGNGGNYNRLGTGPPKYHQGGFGNQGQQRTVSAIGNRPHTSSSYHHMHAGGGRASNPNKDLLTKTELKQYTEEFNFEEMNAQFNKESLHKEFEEKLKIDAAKKLSSALPKTESTDQTLLPTTTGEPKDDEAAEGEDGKDHPQETPELGGADEEKPKDHDDHQEIDSPIFYNKAKSFFDNISCQTNRTHLAKAPFRQFFPQKINTETFGLNQQQPHQYPSGSGRLGGSYGVSYPSGQFGAGPSGGRFHQGVAGYRNFGGQQSLGTGRFNQFQRQWNYGQQQNANRKFGGPSSNAAVKVGAAH